MKNEVSTNDNDHLEQVKLLIVESSENDAIALGEMLAESKEDEFDLFHASSLAEATEILSNETIQLVLLNLFLPDSYGIYTFNDLFKKYPLTPFVVITEFADHHIGRNAVNKGAQDFLVKNELSSDQLLKSIAYALERKLTEERLRASEERYRKLFLRSTDVIYMSTVDGKFIDLNPAGRKLLGYDETELEAIGVGDLYWDLNDRMNLKNELAKTGEVSDYEVRLKKKDGKTELICLLNSIVIKDSDGKVSAYQGIIRDITDKKRSEKALKDSLANLDQANKELQRLNNTLEEKVEERTHDLLKEKELVETQNKEIRESINYAKRIQASILPEQPKIKSYFPDSFIYYSPKDIVSGDFYWFSARKDKAIFAVVDCTGHGVPGAFMSIIGYTQLNEIVSDQKIFDPGVILRELDKRVRIALNQNKATDRNSKDGMELGIITVNFEHKKVEYAGAMRPLFYTKMGELYQIKGDKFSIGGVSRHRKEFNTHRIPYDTGDCFYLFSDGYPDQFGGPRGKKFMSKNVANMIERITHLPMLEQENIVKNALAEWMQKEEQVDDILISGIRL